MIKRKRINTSYSWCLTINNPRYIPDIKTVESIVANPEDYEVAYMYVGREHYNMIDIKYRKLTPHFQMLITFGCRKTFKDVKKLFPRAHIEATVGSFRQALNYCLKEDTRGYKCGQLEWAEYLHNNYISSGQCLIDNYPSMDKPDKVSTVVNKEGVGDGKYYQSPPLPSAPGRSDASPGKAADRFDPFGDPALLAEDWELDRLNTHPRYFD